MLSEDVTRYVELHRAMGFKFRLQDYLLRHFVRFAEPRGDRLVRSETVLEWASQAPSTAQRQGRLLVVRRFAKAMQAEDKHHEVPPADAFGRPVRIRRMPHIYTPAEIRRLLQAARQLTPKGSIRPATYVALFSLLVSTGLRISEALSLQIDDLTSDGLLIRHTKFRKTRLVPLHPTVRQGLDRYLAYRRRVGSGDHSLFISMWGTRLSSSIGSRLPSSRCDVSWQFPSRKPTRPSWTTSIVKNYRPCSTLQIPKPVSELGIAP